MTISAKDVKELREISGAGIMDCKKALQETGGNIEEALVYLQKKGAAAAEKKATRTAAEGLVQTWVSDDQKEAVIVEVNCETDFVAKNVKFQEFVDQIAKTTGASDATTVEELLQVKLADGTKTVGEYVTEQIATIGENINIRRFERFSSAEGLVGDYIHAGGQIGVLVQIDAPAGADREVLDELARDVAMHAAAMNPSYLVESDIPEADEKAQMEIYSAQALESGKPEKIIDRIVSGQIGKWRAESTLVSQPFVKDSDITVGELVKRVDGASIAAFVRYEVGAGIERGEEKSLSEEVAEQLRGS